MFKWIPCDVQGLKILRLSGELNFTECERILTETEEVERQEINGFNRLVDLRGLDSITLDSKEIRSISDRRHIGYLGPSVSSAFLAVESYMYGLARIYSAMMDPAPIDVAVFYTLEECAEWLGVDPARLKFD